MSLPGEPMLLLLSGFCSLGRLLQFYGEVARQKNAGDKSRHDGFLRGCLLPSTQLCIFFRFLEYPARACHQLSTFIGMS